jgi:small subunit ribosomal protein S6
MQQYELLYIVPAQFTDEEVGGIQKQVSTLVTKVGGKLLEDHSLGKIRLAYPIKKVNHGTYILAYVEAEGSMVAELDRQLRLTDEVLRHTIVDRVPGSKSTDYELTSYVAPLSEEAMEARSAKKPARSGSAPRPPRRERTSKPDAITAVAPPAPSVSSTEEKTMSMEELDQKLDKILEGDIAENI